MSGNKAVISAVLLSKFRKRRWNQRNFSRNRHKQCNQRKDLLTKKYEDYEEMISLGFFSIASVSILLSDDCLTGR